MNVSWRAWRSALIVPALFSLGCSHQAAQSELALRVGPGRLTADAATLQDRAKPDNVLSLPEAEWPPAIRELHPTSVRVVSSGVFVEMWRFFVSEEGIFIAFDGAKVEEGLGNDPGFVRLKGQVYWYTSRG